MINQIINNWIKAYKAANINSKIMVGNPTIEEVNQCSERMGILDEAERKMLALEGTDNLPKELQDFIAANNDKGCMGCWISSSKVKVHPECEEKIHRYFEARKKLEDINI